MSDSSLRLLVLLRHIPREPKFASSQQLHQVMQDEGYSVGLRTIQRDLAGLSVHFPLIQNQPTGVGKTGVGWAFARGSQNVSFPVMGSAAALTFSMAMQHLQYLLPASVLEHLHPHQQEAENLLSRQSARQYQGWFDKVRMIPQQFLQPAYLEAAAVESIYQALLESRQFRATYKEEPDRIIHPYGLVQQGNTLYLLCRFYGFDDIRITAMQRYTEVEVLADEVRPFPEFKIDDYLGAGEMQWPLSDWTDLQLVIKLNENLAYHLEETPLADNQTLESDCVEPDGYILRASVRDSYQFRYWLLSQCNQLEVLEPVQLRNWLVEIAQDQSRKYLV